MWAKHSAPKELLVKYEDHEDSAQHMERQKKKRGKNKQLTNEKDKGDSISSQTHTPCKIHLRLRGKKGQAKVIRNRRG